ncbi:S8 family serine peptidase [Chitinimonas arctica]|uniref:S8 family serine peptidase n=1 Tax=Chitinimonas arctica TaxID=2594795 RepID=A0A516SG37_9NEIS|nr:S8 family peptidase [Chitinimonas arctica]QDQ26988.1 S8 family serine peptidase [Chitinimonas arctica]
MKSSNKWVATLSQSALAVSLALAAAPGWAAVAKGQALQSTDRIILKYRNSGISAVQAAGASGAKAMANVQMQRQSRLQSVAARFGGTVQLLRHGASGYQVYKLERTRTLEEVRAMAAQMAKADANIDYAEPDRILRPMAAEPNDTRWADQWDLKNSLVGINAPAAWDLSTGAGVTVAVLDTGYTAHADLMANIVSGGGYDMISDPEVSRKTAGRKANALDAGDWTVRFNECGDRQPAMGSSWHGTHVAGTIAALTNNGSGVAGIAYNARILPVRVLGHCGGYTSDIADGMIWASGGTVADVPRNTTPARVINLSLGGPGACDRTQQDAINLARANNSVVVVAAGNDGVDAGDSNPANCAGVVTVAALRKNGGLASYSNFGTVVDISAPGGEDETRAEGITSTMNAGTTVRGADTYKPYAGTSMATPHVAAVAALMIAAKPSLTPDQVEALLKSSSRPFVTTCQSADGSRVACGTGMLDAYAAVRAAIGDTLPGNSETEPNNSLATANAVAAPATLNATISTTADEDWFKVSLPAGKTLTATMTPANATSDFDLFIYDERSNQLAASELSAGKVDKASWKNNGTTTVVRYVKILRFASTGKYTLKLEW